MHIDKFEREMVTAIGDFVLDWKQKHNDCPDSYPVDMEAGEWYEQFELFYPGPA
jgi:hypothetical protein